MRILFCIWNISLIYLLIKVANERYMKTNYYRNYIERENTIFSQKQVPKNLEMINLGSAVGRFAFCYSRCSKLGYNFAQSPQSLNYDFKILKQFSTNMLEGCVVYITLPICIFMLEDYKQEKRNAKYYFFLAPQKILNYRYYKKPIYTKFPIIIAGKDFLHIFKDSRRKNYIKQRESNYSRENALSEAQRQNEGWIKEFKLKNTQGKELPNDVNLCIENTENTLVEIIEYCKERKFIPILVSPPMSDVLNELFSEEFLEIAYYSNIKYVQEKGAIFLDYRKNVDFQTKYRWFIEGNYWLTKDGREHFMELIEEDTFKIIQGWGVK